jgi:cytoskeletal protein RodZ
MFELGNNLREARQRRRIDLVIAEQDTKIRSKYLAALETEDFDLLPGPVFTRGFLRTYSRYLGLDPQLFIDEYNARFGRFEEAEESHGPVLGRPGLAQERDRRGRRTMRTVAIVTLVALAVLAWLGLRADPAPPTDATDVSSTSRPVDSPDPAPTGESPGALQDAARTAASGAPKPAASPTPARAATPTATADAPDA